MSQATAAAQAEETTKPRVPFWLAVAISVVVTFPAALYFGRFAMPLWAVFVVWAEYFVLGAKPEALRVMWPNFIYGSLGVTVGTLLYAWIQSWGLIGDPKANTLFALVIAYFVLFCVLLKTMEFGWSFASTGLPLFNGVALTLGVFFTGTYWPLFETTNLYAIALLSSLTAIAAGIMGGVVGWFNMVITFPRKATSKA
jgi:hypothetical protein